MEPTGALPGAIEEANQFMVRLYRNPNLLFEGEEPYVWDLSEQELNYKITPYDVEAGSPNFADAWATEELLPCLAEFKDAVDRQDDIFYWDLDLWKQPYLMKWREVLAVSSCYQADVLKISMEDVDENCSDDEWDI
ncbi:hypothetical protein PMIN04_007196 [Paraphaeosphaeria minitans]|uniref:Uncharacterized protein n=1 Tax=Paraphaeosphaeria minitans TaxID=565426 RepID=A0A9P6KPN3_9PLEO|nr:hypothetical protein PMIN01_07103 [Paraphaeosphaeria minitans]